MHVAAFLFSDLADGPGRLQSILGVGRGWVRQGSVTKLAILLTTSSDEAPAKRLQLVAVLSDGQRTKPQVDEALTVPAGDKQSWHFYEWTPKLRPGPYRFEVLVNGLKLYEMPFVVAAPPQGKRSS